MEWQLFADGFPPPRKRGRDMPHTPLRKVVNPLLYVLITDCRWCDLPCGRRWASKGPAPRCQLRWQADGTLAGMRPCTCTTAATMDEHAQGLPWQNPLHIHTGIRGKARARLKGPAVDKSYDAKDLGHLQRREGCPSTFAVADLPPLRFWGVAA